MFFHPLYAVIFGISGVSPPFGLVIRDLAPGTNPRFRFRFRRISFISKKNKNHVRNRNQEDLDRVDLGQIAEELVKQQYQPNGAKREIQVTILRVHNVKFL